METKVIPCLIRVGETKKKPCLIPLDGKDKVTVGRSMDVTVCLMSNMISRCHAIFNKTEEGRWTVCDNKSLNGVHVNGKKLKPLAHVTLGEGDLVQFGVSQNVSTPPEFVYKFYTAAKIKCPVKRNGDTVDSGHSKKLRGDSLAGQARVGQGSDSDDYSALTCMVNSPRVKQRYPSSQNSQLSREKMQEFEQKLAEMQKLLRDKEVAEEEMKKRLQEEQEKAGQQEKIVEELQKKELRLKIQMQEKEQEFLVEKIEITKKIDDIQATLEEKLKEKESVLMNQLAAQREALVSEKLKVEEKLKEEVSRVVEEKNKQLEDELLNQKANLEKVIANKELEQKVLESQLKETQSENVKQKEATLRAREDVLANFTDLMETELQCSICNELFIKATSLACSHSFCQLCISQWMKRKKECPICRTAFTSYTRSIVLDSYIEKMVEQLSEELKDRRKDFIKTREEEQKKFDAESVAQTSADSQRGRGRNGRGRGRRRGGNRSRGGNQGRQAPQAPIPAPIVLSSSSEDSLDGTLSDHEDDVDGEPGAYYGGYGHCYICGHMGHWANGCPFR